MTARRIASDPAAHAPVHFTFDDVALLGRSGDSIASALLANDVAVVGRSFKYRRPRGIYGAWTEEPNAVVDVTLAGRSRPNLRATTELLSAGMRVRSVNTEPCARQDRWAFLDLLWRFLPAGFYYKTFMWLDWRFYERRIRAMAGLGRIAPDQPPAAPCAIGNLHCDLLVIGGGPAGLAAARAASRMGRDVVLVDDRPASGGSLRWRDATIDGMPGAAWVEQVQADFLSDGGRMFLHSTAYGIYDHNLVCVWQRGAGGADRQWRIRAGSIVLATGAIERPLVFADNDRPGIMSAEAALAYLRLHDILVGQRVVLATNNNRAYAVACALRDAGAEVCIADARPDASGQVDGIRTYPGCLPTGTWGRRRLAGVMLGQRSIEADCLLLSGGHTPTVHLFSQARGRLRFEPGRQAFVPAAAIDGMSVVGAAAGVFDLDALLAQAHAAGGGAGRAPAAAADDRVAYAVAPAWPRPGSGGRQWIDFQGDVTLQDIELAARENYRAVEHLKRYTTLGMSTDQGKTSNMNGVAAVAALTGRSIDDTGTTTYRPPYVPVPMSVVAGPRRAELFNPLRRLALEPLHRDAGACLREYGGWLRPAYHGAGDEAAAIAREVQAARGAVAVLDASPLGKIEVIGPQAGALVDFNSYNRISTLECGRIRYGVMLTEGGVVYDDGVTVKLSDTHYIVSCSSSHVQGVSMRLEEWRQDRFDPGQVLVHDSTPQWATLTAVGPRARELVARLGLGVDLADAALPHMAMAFGAFGGREARVARVSFTGDRSYEISVPTSMAADLYRSLLDAGRSLGVLPMGLEALLQLRADKGFIIVGKDTDGTTMPHDLGMDGPRDRRQDEFVGRRSLFLDEAMRPDRRQWVGLSVVGTTPLPVGAHAVETRDGRRRSIGYVTSSGFSHTLGRPVALGMIERGRARTGETLDFYHLGQPAHATVCDPCAFDPEGRSLRT